MKSESSVGRLMEIILNDSKSLEELIGKLMDNKVTREKIEEIRDCEQQYDFIESELTNREERRKEIAEHLSRLSVPRFDQENLAKFKTKEERLNCEKRVVGFLLRHGMKAYKKLPLTFDESFFETNIYRAIFVTIHRLVKKGEFCDVLKVALYIPQYHDILWKLGSAQSVCFDNLQEDASRLGIHELEGVS